MNRLLFASWLLVSAMVASGCKTKPPEPAAPECVSLACVEITGSSPVEIARTLSAVFREAGYQPAPLPSGSSLLLMFEKEGTTGDMVLFGDWSGKKLWHRVRINLKRQSEQQQLVECNVVRVLDHGDPRFEEETKLSRMKRKPYQELLDQVKARLGG